MGGGNDEQDRTRATEVVAVRLGELLEDLLEELCRLPRWRPAPYKVRELRRLIELGLSFFHAWQDAFDGG